MSRGGCRSRKVPTTAELRVLLRARTPLIDRGCELAANT